MTIEPAKFRVIHRNRSLASQRAVRRAMQEILADATNRGCDADTINAMEAVLRNLRLIYAKVSDQAYEPNDAGPEPFSGPDTTNDRPAVMADPVPH